MTVQVGAVLGFLVIHRTGSTPGAYTVARRLKRLLVAAAAPNANTATWPSPESPSMSPSNQASIGRSRQGALFERDPNVLRARGRLGE